MANATTTRQSQGGSDVSTSVKQPTVTESRRSEPKSTTRSITDSGEEVSTSVQAGNTTRTVQKQKIGATLTFTLKITSPPIPKPLQR